MEGLYCTRGCRQYRQHAQSLLYEETSTYAPAIPLRIPLLCIVLVFLIRLAPAAEFSTARIAVYFSPGGGATAAVVREIAAAQRQILVQAYNFTSAPIAKALVDAHKRG